MQKLDLVDDRFPALLAGNKRDTIRWGEGMIVPGMMMYQGCCDLNLKAFVYVTDVRKIKLRDVCVLPESDHFGENPEDFLKKIKRHYPMITLDTEIHYIVHLTPEETKRDYPVLLKTLIDAP